MKLADLKSDSVRRWVEQNPSPTFNKSTSGNDNNNTIDLVSQTFWRQGKHQEEMPMLLQQPPSHHHAALHAEADQPLDFTMSKFKTKTATAAAKQFHQQMMLLQNNGLYFNRTKSGYSSPSSSSEEEGVGPPPPPPPPQVTSPPPSPGPPRTDGESTHLSIIQFLTPARLCQARR